MAPHRGRLNVQKGSDLSRGDPLHQEPEDLLLLGREGRVGDLAGEPERVGGADPLAERRIMAGREPRFPGSRQEDSFPDVVGRSFLQKVAGDARLHGVQKKRLGGQVLIRQ